MGVSVNVGGGSWSGEQERLGEGSGGVLNCPSYSRQTV